MSPSKKRMKYKKAIHQLYTAGKNVLNYEFKWTFL